ncbi:hypothetical protein [Actinoplanes sp. HUAS TT8]|uniref:hypothetical protein n=1 Tax=Actinoplanes sp. HUAS TT8 TaxID=3447453 RepID=UPI003F522B14
MGTIWAAGTYVQGDVCDSVKDTATSAAGTSGADLAALPRDTLAIAAEDFAQQASQLLFTNDLKRAMQALASTTNHLQQAEPTTGEAANRAQVQQLSQAVDTHFKQAETACGLPPDGLRGTTLGLAVFATSTAGSTIKG